MKSRIRQCVAAYGSVSAGLLLMFWPWVQSSFETLHEGEPRMEEGSLFKSQVVRGQE